MRESIYERQEVVWRKEEWDTKTKEGKIRYCCKTTTAVVERDNNLAMYTGHSTTGILQHTLIIRSLMSATPCNWNHPSIYDVTIGGSLWQVAISIRWLSGILTFPSGETWSHWFRKTILFSWDNWPSTWQHLPPFLNPSPTYTCTLKPHSTHYTKRLTLALPNRHNRWIKASLYACIRIHIPPCNYFVFQFQ